MQRQWLQERDRSDYLSDATIAAVITAIGGPVAIVRVSGSQCFEVARKLVDESRRAWPKEDRKLFRVHLVDGDRRPLDDALLVRFTAPRSFTGEDSVEIHVHGGSFTVRKLLEALQALGVRQALPGEFSFRAVRNGKMTLSQAESISDLIAASNQSAIDLALEKMSGTQSVLLVSLAEELRTLATLGEVGIDFSDQDVEELSLLRLKERLDRIETRLLQLLESYDRGHRIQEGVSVSFVGLPNAGKSSFFNALLGEDRSIVSEIAGTTRDVVRERITLQATSTSITLRLEDTAGLRDVEDGVEKIGIERTRRSVQAADLVVWVVDGSSGEAHWQEIEAQWDRLKIPAEKAVGVMTKMDLVAESDRERRKSRALAFPLSAWAFTSAQTGEGVRDAAFAIANFCERWVQRAPGEVLLTRLDHVQAVKEALEHLRRARGAQEEDLFSADVRHALTALSSLIGETVPDDILGRIFSKFCIGK